MKVAENRRSFTATGTFVRDIENLGWTLVLVYFGPAGEEYLFPNEVEVWSETRNGVRLLLTYKGDAIDVSSYVSRRVNPSRTYLASNSKSSQIYSKEKSARYPLSKPILVLLELPRQSRGDWILRIVFFAGNIFRCFVVKHGRDRIWPGKYGEQSEDRNSIFGSPARTRWLHGRVQLSICSELRSKCVQQIPH